MDFHFGGLRIGMEELEAHIMADAQPDPYIAQVCGSFGNCGKVKDFHGMQSRRRESDMDGKLTKTNNAKA